MLPSKRKVYPDTRITNIALYSILFKGIMKYSIFSLILITGILFIKDITQLEKWFLNYTFF